MKLSFGRQNPPGNLKTPPKNAPGGHVLGPTRHENRDKVRLVIIFKEWIFCQSPHPKHFTNSLPSLPKAPGTKTPQKRAWWGSFRADQVRKYTQNVPGGQILVDLEQNPGKTTPGGQVSVCQQINGMLHQRHIAPHTMVGDDRFGLGVLFLQNLQG